MWENCGEIDGGFLRMVGGVGMCEEGSVAKRVQGRNVSSNYLASSIVGGGPGQTA